MMMPPDLPHAEAGRCRRAFVVPGLNETASCTVFGNALYGKGDEKSGGAGDKLVLRTFGAPCGVFVRAVRAAPKAEEGLCIVVCAVGTSSRFLSFDARCGCAEFGRGRTFPAPPLRGILNVAPSKLDSKRFQSKRARTEPRRCCELCAYEVPVSSSSELVLRFFSKLCQGAGHHTQQVS